MILAILFVFFTCKFMPFGIFWVQGLALGCFVAEIRMLLVGDNGKIFILRGVYGSRHVFKDHRD